MKTIKEVLEENFKDVNSIGRGEKFRIVKENFEYIESAISRNYTIKEVYNLLDKNKLLNGIKLNTFKQYYLSIKSDKNSVNKNQVVVKNIDEEKIVVVDNGAFDRIFRVCLVKVSDERSVSNWERFTNNLSTPQKEALAEALNKLDGNCKKGPLFEKLSKAV